MTGFAMLPSRIFAVEVQTRERNSENSAIKAVLTWTVKNSKREGHGRKELDGKMLT